MRLLYFDDYIDPLKYSGKLYGLGNGLAPIPPHNMISGPVHQLLHDDSVCAWSAGTSFQIVSRQSHGNITWLNDWYSAMYFVVEIKQIVVGQ